MEWSQVLSAVVSVSDGQLWLGTDSGLYSIQRDKSSLVLHNVTSVEGSVTTLAWRTSLFTSGKHGAQRRRSFFLDPLASPSSTQYLAHTGSGGLHCTCSKPHRESSSRKATFGLLVVGTENRIYFFNGDMWWFEWVSIWYSGQGGAIDGTPSSLSFVLTGDLFVGNNVSLTRINTNYTFERLGPLQGLPYNQILSLYHSTYTPLSPPAMVRSPSSSNSATPSSSSSYSGTLWIGTTKGFALLDLTSGQFQHYFYGNRWHPGQKVLGFAGSGGNGTVVLTDGGIAVVYPKLWTLEEKAKHYQDMLDRHTRPPGSSYVSVWRVCLSFCNVVGLIPVN